jgi:hypothetical protein
MSTSGQKLKNELHELVPVTVFFFIAFQLLALTDALILEPYGIGASVFMAATIGALVAAKVVEITDHFALVNRFPEKPLVFNVVLKTLIYFVGWLVIRYAEHLFHFWRATGGFGEANRRILSEIVWPHFWAVQLWMLILLLAFCAFRELVRALGSQRVIALFFHPPSRTSPGPPDTERPAS